MQSHASRARPSYRNGPRSVRGTQSACSFDWTPTTKRAVASSCSSLAFSLRSRAICASRGSGGGRPRGCFSPASAPLSRARYQSFAELRRQVGDTCLVGGDDLLATNRERAARGVEVAVNAMIIKVNQVGTVTGARETNDLAQACEITIGDLAPLG